MNQSAAPVAHIGGDLNEVAHEGPGFPGAVGDDDRRGRDVHDPDATAKKV